MLWPTSVLAEAPYVLHLDEEDQSSVLQVLIWSANDFLAGLRDGIRRDDEGATASVGLDVAWLGSRTQGDQHRWCLASTYDIFTERDGRLRTEVLELTLGYALHHDVSERAFVDQLRFAAQLGVQFTGNLGGADLQNTLHSATSTPEDLTFATGLQSTYTAPFLAAAVLALQGGLTKRWGPIAYDSGITLKIPVGPTGVGGIFSTFVFKAGPPRGFSVSLALTAGWQWRADRVFSFEGAPVDGGVVIPSVGFQWVGVRWALRLQWIRNHLGTGRGVGGTRNGEAGVLSLWLRL